MPADGTPKYSLGVDYGTNSVRALIVDVDSGEEIATSVFDYPSGEAGVLLDPKDPHLARQHPQDYLSGFVKSVSIAVKAAGAHQGFSPKQVVGIGVDTTGSTPLPVDADGIALGTKPEFQDHLHAQAWLWKDHTGHAEAAEITAKAAKLGLPYLAKCGGTYSSEWFWSKVLRCQRVAPEVFSAAHSWVELADYVPAAITGNTRPDLIRRSVCAAGHKAMFSSEWGGLPSASFLSELSPELGKLRHRLFHAASPSDEKAGELTAIYADAVGLPAGIPVAVGAFDAHMGAVGSGISPETLVKIIGTSTCDIAVWPSDKPLPDIPGLCGIVDGSVLPGMFGLEAGQSAVGDIFNWFVSHVAPGPGDQHARLTEEAAKLRAGESGLLALDWNNGNRTVLVDPLLTGLIVGQTLHTTAAEIYRALIEATAFGALKIINRFEEYGVKIEQIVNCGGIAEKNPLVMQIYADVCNRPMKLSRSGQTCALGAAIFGSVVGGAHPSVDAAQAKMTGLKELVYRPRADEAATYARLFALYSELHDAFGGVHQPADIGGLMRALLRIRQEVKG